MLCGNKALLRIHVKFQMIFLTLSCVTRNNIKKIRFLKMCVSQRRKRAIALPYSLQIGFTMLTHIHSKIAHLVLCWRDHSLRKSLMLISKLEEEPEHSKFQLKLLGLRVNKFMQKMRSLSHHSLPLNSLANSSHWWDVGRAHRLIVVKFPIKSDRKSQVQHRRWHHRAPSKSARSRILLKNQSLTLVKQGYRLRNWARNLSQSTVKAKGSPRPSPKFRWRTKPNYKFWSNYYLTPSLRPQGVSGGSALRVQASNGVKFTNGISTVSNTWESFKKSV